MKISVIMPVYNKALYVKEAIKSILNQTYNNFELIIVDDCSTDGSKEIIEQFCDRRIKLIQLKKNMGASYAANIAVQNSSGEYILRMDADDLCDPRRIEKQLEFFLLNNSDVVACRFGVFSNNEVVPKGFYRYKQYSNSIITSDDIISDFTVMPTISQGTMMVKREIYKKFLLDSKFATAEDYEQLGRMIINNVKIHKIPEELYMYRYVSSSLSNQNGLETTLNSLKIKMNFIYEYYGIDKNKQQKFIIWGTKEFAGYLEEEIRLSKYNTIVKCFTDFNVDVWGKYKNDIPIVSPDQMIKNYLCKDDIIITMWNIERENILSYLNRFGLKKNLNYFVFS